MIELYNAIKAASYTMAKKDVRYFLNGIHIVKKDGIVTVESSNGYTAFQCKNVNPESVEDDELDVIISASDIPTILKIGKILTIGNGMINGIFKYNTEDGKFPDLDRAIPVSGKYPLPFTTNGNMNFALVEQISKSIKAITGSSKDAGGNLEFIPKDENGAEISSYRITCRIDGPVWVLMPMRGLS